MISWDCLAIFFIARQSQEIIVTFDGYLGLQRKAMYNDERNRNSTKTLDFVVNDGTVRDFPAKVFLTSPTNKQGYINFLNDKINAKLRLTTKKCSDDQTGLLSQPLWMRSTSTNLSH